MMQVPMWARQAVLDFILGAVAAVAALNIAIPGSLSDARAQALVIAVAVAKALLGVAEGVIRAHSADIIAWLRSQLGLPSAG